MDTLIANHLDGKHYIMENVQVSYNSPLKLNQYLDFKKMKITEIVINNIQSIYFYL
jgi:hypothetical protein